MAKGKFKSERQRRFMFATVPSAAHKWAHNISTNKSDWVGVGKGKHKASARTTRRKKR